MTERKYKHLTSGDNYNNVTVSVRESIAQDVDDALDYLLQATRFTKSQVVCDAILAHAKRRRVEDQNEQDKDL
jgi:hypothetical protein